MRRAPARPVRACFARQRCTVPKVPLETPLFTLHSSHFTLRTYTSHSTLHLFSSELFSPHLSSSHLISSHMSPKLNCSTWALLNLSHLFEAPLNSSQLFCMSQSFCRQRQVSCTQKWMRREAFAHRSLRHRCVYTEKPLHKESFCTWEAFTHSTLLHRYFFDTQQFSTQQAGTHRKRSRRELLHTESFYTQQNFTRSNLLHRETFHPTSFYTQKLLHKAHVCLHIEAFTHSKLLHRKAFTHSSFYT